MKVKDIMTENPACCTTNSSLQETAKMMVDCDCGAIPVVEDMENKKPVGVITDRDITVRTVAAGKNPMQMTVGDVMTTDVVTVTADTLVEEVADKMKENQLRRVVVVDNNNSVIGMVAQADIALDTSAHKAGEVVEEVSKATGS